jgi:hypothetical protein
VGNVWITVDKWLFSVGKSRRFSFNPFSKGWGGVHPQEFPHPVESLFPLTTCLFASFPQKRLWLLRIPILKRFRLRIERTCERLSLMYNGGRE